MQNFVKATYKQYFFIKDRKLVAKYWRPTRSRANFLTQQTQRQNTNKNIRYGSTSVIQIISHKLVIPHLITSQMAREQTHKEA